ncbi:MFS transporter [Lentilactobacillus curieae]|uniref:MFS transporter n=1 Tax=Lentilactobacillus curieae TaxID=1138822 RepID=A0A1S6QG94_9LACO|nr:MFS transporter [Lentilactobacillus curieae]AQW20620.1 MFS transporter [Lentilactobacillus curieae]
MEKKNLAIIGVLGSFAFLSSLSGSSTNLALPKIALSLGISSGLATWVVQSGLITTAILLVMFGHLGDEISKSYIFLNGGIAFLIGSAITGFAPTFWVIIVGRIIQAIGSAMIMANSMGIVTDYFPDKRRAEALSYISMFISAGAISGPAVGGLIMSIGSWRWIFWLNIPISLIVLYFGRKVLQIPKESINSVGSTMKGANWKGQSLFTVGMLIFFLSGPFFQGGKDILMGFAFLIVGGGITAYSFIQDDHAKSPWISPKVLHNKPFMISITALFLTMMVNAVSNIMLPFYLQSYGLMTPLQSGLLVMLQSVTMLIVSPLSGILADRVNRQLLTVVGLVVLMVSQVGYAIYPATMQLPLIIWPIVLNGVGMALFLSPNNALTMGLVDRSLAGIAGSVNSFARTLGMTIGISFSSSLLFVQIPGVVRITPQLGSNFMSAFMNVFGIATVVSGLTLIMVLIRYLQNRKVSKKTASVSK